MLVSVKNQSGQSLLMLWDDFTKKAITRYGITSFKLTLAKTTLFTGKPATLQGTFQFVVTKVK